MAVALATKVDPSYGGYGSGTNYDITFPSGLQVGDLLVAIVHGVQVDSSPTPNVAVPTDWTEIVSQTGNNGQRLQVFIKVATSGDVSAGSVSASTQIGGTDNAWLSRGCLRITGQGDIASIQDNSASASSGSASYAIGLTPTFADSLLLIIVCGSGSHASGSVASQAIATDNPSWTEQWDVFADSSGYAGAGQNDGLSTLATASRSAVTATGNVTATISTFSESVGALIIIPPVANASVSPSVITAAASVPAATVTGGATVTPAVITAAASIPAPTASAPSRTVNTPSKSSPTWSNQNKS